MPLESKYETGVIWQDFQHQQLIELFEKVREARAQNKDQNLFRYTVAFLAMYVNHHFSLEEAYMGKYRYPRKDEHQKEHLDFVRQVKTFRDEHKDYSVRAFEELLSQLEKWILNHILGDDQKLGRYVQAYEMQKDPS